MIEIHRIVEHNLSSSHIHFLGLLCWVCTKAGPQMLNNEVMRIHKQNRYHHYRGDSSSITTHAH
jgi:hypothetical protein